MCYTVRGKPLGIAVAEFWPTSGKEEKHIFLFINLTMSILNKKKKTKIFPAKIMLGLEPIKQMQWLKQSVCKTLQQQTLSMNRDNATAIHGKEPRE